MQMTDVQEITIGKMARSTLTIQTAGPGFTDLTAAILEFLAAADAVDGLLSVFVRHTSASLTIQENADPDVRRDLLDALDGLAPQNAGYRHGFEGPDDMPAHIRTMLTDVSITLPVTGGAADVGTWQSVYLVEHRARPHSRTVSLTYQGS